MQNIMGTDLVGIQHEGELYIYPETQNDIRDVRDDLDIAEMLSIFNNHKSLGLTLKEALEIDPNYGKPCNEGF